ncbi:hypothetical protein OKW34_000107 [Paraburkholderia youngii]|uniref:hypothetical protein n=1 Tax=Paraburkholderia youngii TaxID=2782701 RepID=UPI003D206B04
MRSPPFRKAATDARPYGTHRFDVYGPKVGRRLTLFGHRALQFWLRLESDPQVVTYCERPLSFREQRGDRAADFWVCADHAELLYILLRPSEVTLAARGHCLHPALEAWSRAHSMTLRAVAPHELDDSEMLCQNRLTMLHYLAAGAVPRGSEILPAILMACESGETLAELEQRFIAFDPMVVRAAAFSLVLNGSLCCPTIAERVLGPHSCLLTR